MPEEFTLAPPAVTPEIMAEIETGVARMKEKNPDWDTWMLGWRMATEIIGAFLGREWVKDHVAGRSADQTFLHEAMQDESRLLETHLRVIWLAEMLLNFRLVSGFPHVLERLRNNNIEAAFAELEAARYLAQNRCAFRFNSPKGRRGEDFDLEIRAGEAIVSADTKCRLEKSAIDDRRLFEMLNKGRGQLPTDRPGALIVKLPNTKSEDEFIDNLTACRKAVDRFFRGTERVVCCIAFGLLLVPAGSTSKPVYIGFEVPNPKHRFGNDFPKILPPGGGVRNAAIPPNWYTLHDACKRAVADKTTS